MEDEFLTPDEIYEILCEDCNSTGFLQVLLSCYKERERLEVFQARRDRTSIYIKYKTFDLDCTFHFDPKTGEFLCDVLDEFIPRWKEYIRKKNSNQSA